MANYETPDSYSGTGPSTDCWKHASKVVIPAGKWSCAEWQFDGPNNTMRFWLDGAAVDSLTVTGTGRAAATSRQLRLDGADVRPLGPRLGVVPAGHRAHDLDRRRRRVEDQGRLPAVTAARAAGGNPRAKRGVYRSQCGYARRSRSCSSPWWCWPSRRRGDPGTARQRRRRPTSPSQSRRRRAPFRHARRFVRRGARPRPCRKYRCRPRRSRGRVHLPDWRRPRLRHRAGERRG